MSARGGEGSRNGARPVALTIVLLSLGVAAVVGWRSSHLALALICGLFALLGLISLYSLLAHLLGWPKLRWDDAWAIGHLLP